MFEPEIDFSSERELTAEESARERKHARSKTTADLREMMDYGMVTAADGCIVEPDGVCEHGFRSPMLVLRII